MTTPQDPVDPKAAGSAGAQTQEPDPTPASPKEEHVPYDKYRDLLDEKKKAAKRAKDAEDKLALIEEEKLKASGDLQKILDAEKVKSKALEDRVSSYESRERNAKKLNAFLKSAGPNLDDKWLSLVDIESIQFKPDTDEVDQMSVATQVDSFKKTWPEAFKAAGSMPPATVPNGSGKIAESAWQKLAAKEMKKYKPTDIEWGK